MKKRLVDAVKKPPPNGRARRKADEYPEDQRGDAWEPPPEFDGGPEPELPELGILLSTVKPEQRFVAVAGTHPAGQADDPGRRSRPGKIRADDGPGRPRIRGLGMPDGTPCEAAGVVVLNAEDGLADTVLPRLLAAGGDPARVLALTGIPDDQATANERSALPDDLLHLRGAIDGSCARLVIVDPLMAFLAGE